MLDTETRPPRQNRGVVDPASQRPKSAPRDNRRHFPRLDVVLGLASGFAVALAFGAPIFSWLGTFWTNVVVPAFYTLAQTGLAYCGF